MTNTDARTALATLTKDKVAIQDQLDHASAQLRDVHAAERAEHSARKQLDELASSEAAATSAWASGKIDTAPIVNSKDRAALEAEVKSAAVKATEARAKAAPMAEATALLHSRLRQVDREIQLAKVAVLAEALEPALVRLETAVREVIGSFVEVSGAADFIAATAREDGRIGTANPDLEFARPMLAAAERLRERVNTSMSTLQYGMTRFPDGSRWERFLSTLSHDAAAGLDAA